MPKKISEMLILILTISLLAEAKGNPTSKSRETLERPFAKLKLKKEPLRDHTHRAPQSMY